MIRIEKHHRSNRIIAFALTLIMMLIYSAAGMIPDESDAHAATGRISADLQAGKDFNFDGFPTRYWTAEISGKIMRTAYCIQPSRYPDEGASTASRMSDSSVLGQALYYCRGYAGWPTAEPRLRKLAGSADWFTDEAGSGYVLCHYILSSIYNDPSGEWKMGITQEHAAFVTKAAALIKSLPDPPNSDVSISPAAARAGWLADDSGYLSDRFRLSADRRNFITIKSSAGMTVYNYSNSTTASSGSTVRVYGGQTFGFKILNAAQGGKVLKLGPFRAFLRSYEPYKFDGNINSQDIAFFAIDDVESKAISIRPSVTGYGKLLKTKEETDGNYIGEQGAEFRVWNTKFSSYEEAADNEYSYACTMKTDSEGNAVTERLMPGEYFVKQTAGSPYHNFAEDSKFTIGGKNGETVSIGGGEVKDDLIRMKLLLQKRDSLSGRPIKIKGAEFRIYDSTGKPVVMRSNVSTGMSGGMSSDIFVTDENGAFTTPEALKGGKYRIVEVKAPKGYKLSPEKTVEISQDVEDTSEISVENDTLKLDYFDAPMTGEININKKGSYTADGEKVYENLPNVKFNIIALEDIITGDGTVRAKKGETVRTAVTDEKGAAAVKGLFLGRYGVVEKSFVIEKTIYSLDENDIENIMKRADGKLSSETADRLDSFTEGIMKINGRYCFADGEEITDNILIAALNEYLPEIDPSKVVKGSIESASFRNYRISDKDPVYEAVLTSSEGTDTVKYDISVVNDGEHSIRTSAFCDLTGSRYGVCGKYVPLTDTVTFSHLIPGVKYNVIGILMDKKTGKQIYNNRKPVTASAAFIPKESDGKIDVSFTIDSTALNGHSTVVFEKLFMAGKLVCEHSDLQDDGQTIYWPNIVTSAEDYDTGTHIGKIGEETITDTVKYHNLAPGHEYTVIGTLMDKSTCRPILIDGKEVVSSKKFTAAGSSGSVELMFRLDSKDLSGKEVVVFEKLMSGGIEIVSHENINDKGQTVRYISIRTSAGVNGSHTASADKTAVITDEVSYNGLEKGKEYTLKGILKNGSDGSDILIDGKPVVAVKKFKADESNGRVKIDFVIDATSLSGMKTVVFETLYKDGVKIASHEDINDRDQTIKFYKKATPATGDVLPVYSILLLLLSGTFLFGLKREGK